MLAFSRFQRDFAESAPEIRTVGQAEFAPLQDRLYGWEAVLG